MFSQLQVLTKNLIQGLLPYILEVYVQVLRFPITRRVVLFATQTSIPSNGLKKIMKWGNRRATIIRPSLSTIFTTGKALIVYYSKTGNTKKVATAIESGLKNAGLDTTVLMVSEAVNEDYFDYDIVCFGTPVMHGLPPAPVRKLIQKKFAAHRDFPSDVRLPSAPIPGKYALVFTTFSGPHVGVDEAFPTGKFVMQELEHLGFNIIGEWYLVGEFKGWEIGSTKGKLGDIRGRPNTQDLKEVEEKTINLIKALRKGSEIEVQYTNC
jgi:hypothetical protein